MAFVFGEQPVIYMEVKGFSSGKIIDTIPDKYVIRHIENTFPYNMRLPSQTQSAPLPSIRSEEYYHMAYDPIPKNFASFGSQKSAYGTFKPQKSYDMQTETKTRSYSHSKTSLSQSMCRCVYSYKCPHKNSQ